MGLVRAFSILLLTLVLPTAATAVELNLSAEVSTLYDNNVFRGARDDRQKDDMSIRFGPLIHLHSQEKALVYSFRYRPVYEKFVSSNDIDALSHLARGEMTYSPTDKTKLTLSDRFAFTQTVNRVDLDLTGNVLPDAEVERNDIYRNEASLAVSHHFSARTIFSFVATNHLFYSERPEISDSISVTGVGSLSHALDARNRVGVGGGVTWQDFERSTTTMMTTVPRPASETLIYRSFVSWVRKFGDSAEFSVRGGPAFIRTKQSLMAMSPIIDDTESRFTFFGEVNLTKRWTSKLNSKASYSRSDSSVSSLGASTIADRVSFVNDWKLNDRWTLDFRGDWVSRKSANKTEFTTPAIGSVDNTIDTEYWAVSSRATVKASRRTRVSLRVTYQDQNTKRGVTASNASFDNVLVFLSFRYDFDPIHL